MSSLLALSFLRKSLKCSLEINSCRHTLKKYTNLLQTTQSLATKSNISTSNTNSTPNPTDSSNDEWRTIYNLPLIILASAFNRLKISYGILNGVTIPVVFALEQSTQLPPSSALLVSSIGLTSWCTLAICSLFVRNLIGIIYINNNNDKLKLAYVDYWGKRHDVCVELNDVIPENEKPKPSKVDFYQSICLYSDDKVKYKLLSRFGRIEDLKTFATIFGD